MNTSEHSTDYLAHVLQAKDDQWREHLLEEHLREVADLAAKFAAHFGGEQWANAAGIWHDLGKYRKVFQSYIKKASGYDPEAHIEQGLGRVDHSTAGAIYACQQLKGAGQFLAYLIAGHHAGLPDWDKAEAGGAALSHRLKKGRDKGYLEETLTAFIPPDILKPDSTKSPLSKPLGGEDGLHLWLRILFSCLTDADFLDTERFMAPEKAISRQAEWSMSGLKKQFDTFIAKKISGSTRTDVNIVRENVLNDCRQSALEMPGIFTLTVPTGGGKTLSGMAFALEHAVKHGKTRIIVAIPYTSIIEQTAEQYREIFGDAVLEHHSNLDPDDIEKETARSRLAAENWDAPIIVTTNVQLLESLFAARTSRCRKLHNIVNSVILLDEAQLLPPDFLQPILDVLRLLTEHYGVSLVLSTATQPALGSQKDSFGTTRLRGLDAKREIITDVDALFERMRRTEVIRPLDLSIRRDWASLAKELEAYPCVLVIVNSRRDAYELFSLMPPGTVHLSALMCGEHRSAVITEIKKRLKAGIAVRVVSTQLVEAGVDLDFPVVYRALAGLDSIAQAAGRCNREGNLERDGKLVKGKVVVFVPPRSPAKGLLLYGEQATRSVWHGQESDLLSHRLYERYFNQYFSQENPDKHQIMPLLTQASRYGMVQFRSAAQRFSLIPDSGVSVLVPFGKEGFKLMDQLRYMGPERWLMRKLQRLTVNIYENDFKALRKLGAIEELQPDIWGVCVTNAYDQQLGLLTADVLNKSQPDSCVF
ncbi:CRISPR-associated helicase Cas3' [Rheinheimera sediminis]|uniref:CRISPR-associated helicase Cas3' n=1 Tax=Rheinheimera sp. YQF-1 TaxID=2499626 RepID=UPI0016484484|nr:CRISPR-associated helicase Cas3' [Rheinheimera sp. YQF-1]